MKRVNLRKQLEETYATMKDNLLEHWECDEGSGGEKLVNLLVLGFMKKEFNEFAQGVKSDNNECK